MEYDEYEPKPQPREIVIAAVFRAIPYIVGIAVLALAVAVACRIAARIETRGAADQWGCIIQNAIRETKNPRERQ